MAEDGCGAARVPRPARLQSGADAIEMNREKRRATYGPDEEAIRRAHEKLHFPHDSITEGAAVTGVDLRPADPEAK